MHSVHSGTHDRLVNVCNKLGPIRVLSNDKPGHYDKGSCHDKDFSVATERSSSKKNKKIKKTIKYSKILTPRNWGVTKSTIFQANPLNFLLAFNSVYLI